MRNPFFRIKRTYTHLVRYRRIMGVLMKYGFEEMAGVFARRLKVGLGSKGLPTTRMQNLAQTSLPQRMRMAAEELGPTFIKLGQMLSTRPDLIPHEYVSELERLQDSVAPEKYEAIRNAVKQQLGAFPEDIFETFDPVPLAAASIAQVHRVRTKEGREGVVKIRRPGIVKTIHTDMEMIQDIAALVKLHLGRQSTIDPVRMVSEFTQAVTKEVDFANERRNQQRFFNNFADDSTVHVPEVFEAYCSDGILTMEFIGGVKPSYIDQLKNAGLDPTTVAARGADFVLKQVFDDGFFHTDPHPGNFLILPGNVLAPLDFGQVGRLTRQDRVLLQYIVLSVVDSDASKIIQGLEGGQMLADETDIAELTRDLEEILSDYANLPLKDIPFGEALRRAFDVIRRHSITPPRDFTLMLKSLMTIEAFATDLNTEFQIIDSLKPYARKFALQQVSPENLFRQLRKATRGAGELAARFPEDAAAIIGKFRRGNFKMHVYHDHLEELEQTLDNSSNRISFAVIIAALLIASSLLVSQTGDILGIVSLQTLGAIGYLTAAVMGVWLLASIIRHRRF
ncbi:MAG: ubiquinone biosynthesis protein UbiB [Planctomycetota bacterium]|nr:MAG: ubiquinone biosynthesis protein UbiB [Planctomycetota bacterium]